jgi:hypothetical protein
VARRRRGLVVDDRNEHHQALERCGARPQRAADRTAPAVAAAAMRHAAGGGRDATILADQLVHEEAGDAATWILDTLAALPGAAVATRPVNNTAWLAGTRDGHLVRFDHVEGFGPALASVALAWSVKGNPLCSLPERIALSIGGTCYQIEATLVSFP